MGVTGTLSSHIFGIPCFELPFPPLHVNNHSVDALDSNFLLERRSSLAPSLCMENVSSV